MEIIIIKTTSIDNMHYNDHYTAVAAITSYLGTYNVELSVLSGTALFKFNVMYAYAQRNI